LALFLPVSNVEAGSHFGFEFADTSDVNLQKRFCLAYFFYRTECLGEFKVFLMLCTVVGQKGRYSGDTITFLINLLTPSAQTIADFYEILPPTFTCLNNEKMFSGRFFKTNHFRDTVVMLFDHLGVKGLNMITLENK
jgi:hypothetical protein